MINLKELIEKKDFEDLIRLGEDDPIRDSIKNSLFNWAYLNKISLENCVSLQENILNDDKISEKDKVSRLKSFELLFSSNYINLREIIVITNIYNYITKIENYSFIDNFLPCDDINNLPNSDLIDSEDLKDILLKLVDLCVIEIDNLDNGGRNIYLTLFEDLIL